MKSLRRFLLWSTVFLLLLIVLDQIVVRVPLRAPVFSQGRDFYLGFRERILDPPAARSGPSGEKASFRPPRRPPAPGPRYVYVDGEGALQFADSLEEIPSRFREEARPLEP